MQIFLDTEFTNFNNPRLLSIGAVAEDGRHFYGVVAYQEQQGFSPFVRDTVVHLLDGHPPDALGSAFKVALAFADWLREVCPPPIPVVLCADYEVDLELARQLLESVASRRNLEHLSLSLLVDSELEGLKSGIEEYFIANPDRERHNALDDAFALRFAVQKQV